MNNNNLIFVDLDGTLIKTDLLFESALKFIKKNPLNIFLIFIWLLGGKSNLKHNLANRIEIDPESLPYQNQLLGYLKERKSNGASLILATASHAKYANSIAQHLGIFDNIIATDAQHNMKGTRKLEEIKIVAKGSSFSYAGDNKADRPIWQAATGNIFVNAPKSDIEHANANNKTEKIIETRDVRPFNAFVKEMRLHQWAKNALIFVPLFAAHEYGNPALFLNVVLAFISFSLCASGVYFLNDLLDISADRQHKTKKNRPLASGDLSIPLGAVGALLLPIVAFLIAIVFLSTNFVIVLGIYLLITNAYSFFLKTVSTADVMTLAVLYTMRVVAGSAATGIILSSWLMAFSIFVFVSLAYLKRYIELSALQGDGNQTHGRGYSAADSETMFALGISNVTASVLVLAFYINDDEVTKLYSTPEILWALCLLILYWGNRIWVGARRGKISDDPVVFAIKDKVSRMVVILFVLVAVAAKFVKL